MTLINFKGIKRLTVDFGQVTEIRGANATGKSTIADAFNWVLFGKDAAGNSDSKFGIKTNDKDGKAIPKLDHEVTALLDVDGQTVELRRVLSEDWVTPRGKAETELKGNSTAYFYNGVPLKESEYKAKINAIIDEDLFRMLTNPLYFPRLDWAVQREILLKIAGEVALEEIAAGRSEFAELLTQLSGKSLKEIKNEIAARKKKIKEALELIPARIDEVTRATPKDYVQNEKTLLEEKARLEGYLSEIDKAMENKAEASRQQYKAIQETQRQINELKSQQQKIIFDAQIKVREDAFAANAKRREIENNIKDAETEIATLQRADDNNTRELIDLKAQIEKKCVETDNFRKMWHEENVKEYQGNDICPTCGQSLPENMKADARKLFADAKTKTLSEITEKGKKLSKEAEILNKEADKLVEQGFDVNTKLLEQQEALKTLKEKLAEMPVVNANVINPDDLTEWKNLQENIDVLSKSIKNKPANPDNSELTAKKQDLTTQLDEIKKQLNLRAVVETNEKRKAELLKEEKELAQQKADLEKQEFVAETLVKEQMNEVECRVNLKFNLVRFKMFSQQINGGEKPDCILISQSTGAKFLDTNNADKINIGLDIINTLCEFNGVSAPIFIDNAEGINKLIPINSQLIKLIVTNEKELTINL
ncbi:MAG: AAA family ATPase [Prevotellaceae bacterium]|nr:AAA family ATPase [Prevotellaceae bacterium]